MEINKGKIKEFKILEVATDSRAVDEDEEEHSLRVELKCYKRHIKLY